MSTPPLDPAHRPVSSPARPVVSTRPQTDSKASRRDRSQLMFGDLYAVVGQYLDSDLDIGVVSERHEPPLDPAR
jgi:hypothetical protein